MKTSSYFVYSKFITTLTPALKNLPGSVFTSSFSKTSCEFSSLKHEGTDPSYISNCPTYNVFYLSSLSFLKDVSFQNDSNSLLRLSNSDLGGFILLCWYRNSYGQHIWSCWPPYLQVMLLALNYVSIDFETVDNCIQFECLEKSFWITDIALLWLNSFLPDHYYSFVLGHTCSAWSSISLGLVLYYLRPLGLPQGSVLVSLLNTTNKGHTLFHWTLHSINMLMPSRPLFTVWWMLLFHWFYR